MRNGPRREVLLFLLGIEDRREDSGYSVELCVCLCFFGDGLFADVEVFSNESAKKTFLLGDSSGKV